MVVFLQDCRKKYLDQQGNVNWNKVAHQWTELSKIKVSLANKYFTPQTQQKAGKLAQEKQQILLDIMMGGLENDDSSVGAYATRPEDYDEFAFYLEPLIRDYHGIQGDTKQQHDWNVPLNTYLLTNISPQLNHLSMRARVARNVVGWNLPPKMTKEERLRFEQTMVAVFQGFGIEGTYNSLTPGHKNQISQEQANKLIEKHFLFNDMTTDNHLTSSGVASDWPHGRGIWVSKDQTKMIWIGQEDQLRIISIMHGTDLGAVDNSLYELLSKIEAFGLKFAQHPVYGIITTCPTNMGTGKRQSILGKFPKISNHGKDQKKLKELAKSFGLQARGMGGEHSSMDSQGTADISPSARFGVKESFVTRKLYEGLVNLYNIEYENQKGHQNKIVFLQNCRKKYLDSQGRVDWNKVAKRWDQLKKVKTSLANKYFTPQTQQKAGKLAQEKQQILLDIMMGGLENDDSSVGAYATRPEDYDEFAFYLEPLIRDYHGIQGDTKQQHDWNVPLNTYLLTNISPQLNHLSMRARVARNVVGWNLPPKMTKEERLRFEQTMVAVFQGFGIEGTYNSLTPGHKNQISQEQANKLIEKHFLFNDMTTDNHLTSSGVASDWPHGRGIWVSKDQTKMIWIGQEDQLRIISIMHGTDLGAVDNSLYELLSKIEAFGLKFAQHPVYGIITTCPTNMGTGKRQSILGKFPKISNHGKDQKKLKELAKSFGLQARGMGGEHSSMDSQGTADISPSARFGVKESFVTRKLYEGLVNLYNIEYENQKGHQNKIVFLQNCRKKYLDSQGRVDWNKVAKRWDQLKKVKTSLANKYFTPQTQQKAGKLAQEKQQILLDIMMGGLENDDSSVGAYATRPEDYDEFAFYLEPLIRDYHGIQGDTKQQHDWNVPLNTYLLTNISPQLNHLSMRARVARNVVGWNLPPKMTKEERLRFEQTMVAVFQGFGIEGTYNSLTPGHKNQISQEQANKLIEKHFLFNDMTTDNHLTSSGVASDWPHGRGIWVSKDQTKMIWIGQEDQLRIISIMHGTDLGAVDNSLYELLSKIEAFGLKFAQHPVYGIITTCPTNMGTGKRQSILGKFPKISNHGKDQKKLKELAKSFGLQARGMGGEHSSMDSQGTADISPSARFGVKESFVTRKLYEGLVNLYNIEYENQKGHQNKIVFLQNCRKKYLDSQGRVDWNKVAKRWDQLKKVKTSLANKYFTPKVKETAKSIEHSQQHRLLDIMMGGLENDDSSVGAYATRPEDYDIFSFYLEPLIRDYHGIQGDTRQEHDWKVPLNTYLLTNIHKNLKNLSMRARVARNVIGYNLPPKMNKQERLRFESAMVNVFENFGIPGTYSSLTPGHKNQISQEQANKLIEKHFLFNDMTTDNHLTSSGVASDWPHGRGIWVSKDQTKMIWVGQEDQLRIISIMHGTDLGAVDNSLYELLSKIEAFGLKFAQHPVYGIITTCPTNMGTGKRQSILGKFPKISNHGKDQKKLKELAKSFGLQARGMGGEHSSMDSQGTADISPSARFGVKESFVTRKLYLGLVELYKIEYSPTEDNEASCELM